MKKLFSFFIILLVLLSMVFAEETFWCLNATQRYGSSGDQYRFNYSTVFDLEKYYKYNNSTTPIIGAFNQSNGLDEAKALGTVGVGGCSHEIIYTIDPNGGKFVSQSDPSKYRNYYVVFVPDYSTPSNTTSRYYYYDNVEYTSSNSAAPGTKINGTYNNVKTFNAPITDGSDVVYSSSTDWWGNTTYNYRQYSSIGLDLFLCMDQLTNDDLTHIAANDDYVATITVSWHCSENCPEHSGTFNMVVRGYYGSNSGQARDSFLMIVNPTSDATMLDLKNMIVEDQAKTISNIVVSTTTKEGDSGSAYEWRDHIHAFLSASSNYNAADTNGFVLTKMTNRSITIPYTLTVYNTTTGAPSTGQTYDGKGYYTNSNSDSFYIDLRDYSKSSTNYYAMSYDRYGTYYYAINYSGRVEIKISNYTIPGSGNSLKAVMMDPVTYDTDYTKYIGKYESNIYYHIVYDD